MTKIKDAIVDKLQKDLLDKGLLIEAGFVGLMDAAYKDAPQYQKTELRNAFFAGAQHLFSTIMSVLDPGDEPTDDDLKRMDQIDAELQNFIEGFMKKHGIN